MSVKKEIFDFNYISKKLQNHQVSTLKSLYSTYHKKAFCYKSCYKRMKNLNISLNILSVVLTSTGVVVGGVTLNPIVLGSLSGVGLALQTFIKMKGFSSNIEMMKFAYTSYEKI